MQYSLEKTVAVSKKSSYFLNMNSLLNALKKFVQENVDFSFPLHSRVHPMQGLNAFVKREDELGFGVSGSKLRKYVSLLPILRTEKRKVALLGSAYSNHILSLVQLLKQDGISYRLFLQKPNPDLLKNPKGNFFFLSLLVKQEEIIWIDSIPDPMKDDFCQNLEKEAGESFFWVPVGGAMCESLAGSLTLPLDLLENEQALSFSFDHIFVDAGSGMSALSLILGLSCMKRESTVHVVLMGGTKESFEESLFFFQKHLESILGLRFSLCNYEIYAPTLCKSFGSTNQTLFAFISEIAQKEGIFLDPIYTSKLLWTVKNLEKKLEGKILWIHSGGALSLSGFQESFKI